ncbi:peptidase [Leifsonia poae]|uniref:peptidase n=1 Tax=Leifsonia poae TaxID=110933 RepID=UPI003D665578
MIDWGAFLIVFAASLIGSCVVVGFYALGTRLLAVAGRALFVEPVEFTDAITVISPEEAARAAKKAKKARKRNPLTDGQKRAALTGAYACFTVCGAAVLYGLYLIIPFFHQ